MINIRVFEIRKYYKWVYIFITCFMFILAFKLFTGSSSILYSQAKGFAKSDNLVTVNTLEKSRNNLFILMINKTYPAMEVNYILENGDDSYSNLYKLALGKIVKFDYQDPRSLLRAQLPVLTEIDDDLSEVSYNFAAGNNSENLEINEPTQEREIIFVERKPSVDMGIGENNDEAEDVSAPMEESASESLNENPSTNVPIITSPIKMPNKVKLSTKEPVILIYHTHGTESYLPEVVGNFHSLNKEYTVRAVGEQLTKHMKNKGFNIIHDQTIHDYPSYQQSYIRGLETLKTNLTKNPSLKIVFDIHRDAAPKSDDARENSYITINNEKVARFSIVVGTANDNAEELMTFAEYIRAISDELYPGLAKKTITKEFKFNQYNSDYYALLEVGNTANDINEAIRTSKYLAEILEKAINGIRE